MFSKDAIILGSILSCFPCFLSKRYRICLPNSLHPSYLSDKRMEFFTNARKKIGSSLYYLKTAGSLVGWMYSIAASKNTKAAGTMQIQG